MAVCDVARCDEFVFFSSRRRHTRYWRDWSSDVCSSDLGVTSGVIGGGLALDGRRWLDCPATSTGMAAAPGGRQAGGDRDRQSVVEGMRVELGGCRIIKQTHITWPSLGTRPGGR